MPGIFISYRRSDNPDAVGRIYDRLVSQFGKARVFKDVDSIPLGQDFRGHLNEIIGECAAVLAIIGPKWVDTRNSAGQRRLEDPDDFVRIELEAALARDVPVVPVLVGHAAMPGNSEVPASLASMVYRQSIEVRPDPDFHNDATRLVSALKVIIDPDAPQDEPAPVALPMRQRRFWPAAFAAATLVAIALAIPALRHLRETPLPETRFEIPIPDTSDPQSPLALSPDGRLIVYGAGTGNDTRLWLRPLATTTAQPLAGTEGAISAFWSPDSRSIGFIANGALKRLDLGGGAPLTLVASNARSGGSWNAEGIILFSRGPGAVQLSIARVSATGGVVTDVSLLDATSAVHQDSSFLPDGHRFLFTYRNSSAPRPNVKVGTYLGTLDGRAPVRLTTDTGPFSYLPSGWLLQFKVNQRVLVAQRLDVDKAALVGEPVTLAQGRGSVSSAAPGIVAFRSTSLQGGERQLAWRDRTGSELGSVGEPDPTFSSPRVSPDGRQVAVARGEEGKQDIWLLDGVRSTRITFEGAGNSTSVWSPDGSRIAYAVSLAEGRGLYLKPVNGVGEAERLRQNDGEIWPTSWSQDGRFLLYIMTNFGIGVLPLAGDRKSSSLVGTSSLESWGQFSPDGKWVAYQSDASGRHEIYVRPFVAPGTEGAGTAGSSRWQVSVAGGIHPTWSRPDGKELFFINPLGEMMAVPIAVKGSALDPGRPVRLFQTRILNGGVDMEPGRQYDVARDGRFLINQVSATGVAPITLIQNWNPDAIEQ